MFFGIVLSHKLLAWQTLAVVCAVIFFVLIIVLSLLQKRLVPAITCIVSFFLGILLAIWQLNIITPQKCSEGDMTIVGQIEQVLVDKDYYETVVLKNVTADGENIQNISLTIFDKDESFKVGQILTFDASLDEVQYFTLGEYNSSPHRYGYYYTTTIYASSITQSQMGELSLDEKIRQYVKNILSQNMSDDNYVEISYAVIFGDKSEISEEISQDYKSAGAVHILAVSGLHVGFIAGLLISLLNKCKLKKIYSFFIIVILLCFYNYLCGFSPSVVRATIMVVVGLIANLFGRRNDMLSTIGLAGLISLLAQPLWALDVGFQLSYFCVISIALLSKSVSMFLKKYILSFIADAFGVSIAISIGTLPILAYMNQSINILSIFINLMTITFFSFLFPLLITSLFISAIFPFMRFLLRVCEFGFFSLTEFVKLASNNVFVIELSRFSLITTCLILLILFVLGHIVMLKTRQKIIIVSLFFMILGVNYLFAYLFPIISPGVSVISYYSNQSVVIENSAGQTLMVGYNSRNESNITYYQGRNIDFLLEWSSLTNSTIENTSFKSIVSTVATDLEVNNFYLIETNVEYSLGDFTFTYLVNGSAEGYYVYFDDIRVFISSNNKTFSLDEYYDIVIGNCESQAEYIVSNNTNLNTNKLGNFKILTNSGKVRCLD